jgi:Ca-activated chloride channel homolog
MIHLAWPWLALLLPLPWLHYRWRRSAQPHGAALFMPFVNEVVSTTSVDVNNRRRGVLWFALIWSLLVLAAMRPQWLGDPLPVPTTGRKVLLAVDVSGSMAEQDMAGNATRLQVVQRMAGQFIDGRQGDQVGLILFGTQPYLQTPLSPDLATVHRFLDEAVVGVAGTSTAIGDAIGLAIKRLRAANEQQLTKSGAADTILILLTDGASNAGAVPPIEAARLAAQSGLRIYTIGVGAVAQDGFFGASGNTDLDEDTLRAIAKATGGEYFRAADAEALQAVYRQIDKLEPVAGRQQWLRPADEWFAWPLGLALLLSVPAAWLGARTWT